jgi:biopolymer transport protein ExbD
MPLKTQHDEAPTLNLTSMIDVLFLLIIFFMVATKFDELERSIDVAVPEVSQAGDASPAPQPQVVSVHADGHIELNGIALSEEELTAQLATEAAADKILSVIIRGDAQCPFQHVASALAACRGAGISELGITVRIAALGTPSVK